ncbi:hypothetical protein HDU93_008011 [Gonapodya sp. JEL0774]|nr:hypothetical protein HDU93_008011 [Gonapodya sp. JEL0774]
MWKWPGIIDGLRAPHGGWTPRDVGEAVRAATGRSWDVRGLEAGLEEAELGLWGDEWRGLAGDVVPWVIGCALSVAAVFREGGVIVGGAGTGAGVEASNPPANGSGSWSSAGAGVRLGGPVVNLQSTASAAKSISTTSTNGNVSGAPWKRARIPMLRCGRDCAVTLSQILSLLSLSFLSLHPRRSDLGPDSEYASFPSVNFNVLWRMEGMEMTEKVKCLLAYWKGTRRNVPRGTVTFHRRYLPPASLPRWSSLFHLGLADLALDVRVQGDIFGPEGEENGALMVDFANKDVGGGVIGKGAVQEELLFLMHPEFIAARLFTERLEDTECLFVTGAQRWSRIEGYGRGFQFKEAVNESGANRDSFCRIARDVVAIDALPFTPSTRYHQYTTENLIRELNKAYVGFLPTPLLSHGAATLTDSDGASKEVYPPVSTGNWGCGVFCGDPEWKWAIQCMAARAAGRSGVRYFTFEDENLAEGMGEVWGEVVKRNLSVGTLYHWLCKYMQECIPVSSKTGRPLPSAEPRRSVFRFLLSRMYALDVDDDNIASNPESASARPRSESNVETETIASDSDSDVSKEVEELRKADLELDTETGVLHTGRAAIILTLDSEDESTQGPTMPFTNDVSISEEQLDDTQPLTLSLSVE